jgi:hypothetical protein
LLKKFSVESLVLCVICLADLGSTVFLVSYRDFSEGNPLMSFYLEHGIAAFVLAKVTLFIFPLFILEWARRHRPLFAKMATRACIGLYIFAYVSTVIQLNDSPLPLLTQMASAKAAVSSSIGLQK